LRTLDAEVIVADGSADTATLAELVEEQPAALTTVTETLAEEPLPAVHVIARVPAPAVIVPPVRFQEYAAPAPASSVLAAFPGEAAQTAAGAVMRDDGGTFTATLADPEPAQPAADATATDTVVLPDGPAVKVMFRDPAPEINVPLTTVHAYVAPAPASATEAAPDSLAQRAAGAVTATEGIG